MALLAGYLAWIGGCDPSNRARDDQPDINSTPASTCSLLIQNINIVDVVNGVVRERQDVCIDGADIVAVQDHEPNQFRTDTVVRDGPHSNRGPPAGSDLQD